MVVFYYNLFLCVVVAIDILPFSTPARSTQSSDDSSVALILGVGVVVGGAVLIIAIIVVVVCCLRSNTICRRKGFYEHRDAQKA